MVLATTVLGDGWPGPGSWVGNLQERKTILAPFVTGSFKERHILLTALERVASTQQVSEASLAATRRQADKILEADWNRILQSQLITPGRCLGW
jgi:hypothetical protein